MKWETSAGEDRYRRGMYTFWKRSVPYPGQLMFDAPNGDFSCVRRTRSNTPLQALTTLNETVFMDAARALAARVLKEGGKTDNRMGSNRTARSHRTDHSRMHRSRTHSRMRSRTPWRKKSSPARAAARHWSRKHGSGPGVTRGPLRISCVTALTAVCVRADSAGTRTPTLQGGDSPGWVC